MTLGGFRPQVFDCHGILLKHFTHRALKKQCHHLSTSLKFPSFGEMNNGDESYHGDSCLLKGWRKMTSLVVFKI